MITYTYDILIYYVKRETLNKYIYIGTIIREKNIFILQICIMVLNSFLIFRIFVLLIYLFRDDTFTPLPLVHFNRGNNNKLAKIIFLIIITRYTKKYNINIIIIILLLICATIKFILRH